MTTSVRTITCGEWEDAAGNSPVKTVEIGDTVDRCMLELNQQGIDGKVDCTPWSGYGEGVLGAMWAGVPTVCSAYKDESGGWMISTKDELPSTPGVCSHYIRLSSAPSNAEVQYGFCTLVQDKFEEFVQRFLAVGGVVPAIKCIPISPSVVATFRIDKMVVAALKVAHGCSGNEASNRFRELLGLMELDVFLADMLGKCYSDSFVGRDVLRDRSPQYVEMMSIITEEAYPGVLNPTRRMTDSDLKRFCEANSLSPSGWSPIFLYPVLHNIVMPKAIFDAVDTNMEAGIPPVVPQYVTSRHHMFNGSWSSPCPGQSVSGSAGVSIAGRKILSGTTNAFNTDLYGYTSYWPFEVNPPQEWVDLFVNQLTELKGIIQPMSTLHRTDLALSYARNIPAVLAVEGPCGWGALKYKKLVGLETDTSQMVQKVVIRECDSSGEWCDSLNPTPACSTISPDSGTISGTDEGGEMEDCYSCGNGTSLDELISCSGCNGLICDGCVSTCQACERIFCKPCQPRDGHECEVGTD